MIIRMVIVMIFHPMNFSLESISWADVIWDEHQLILFQMTSVTFRGIPINIYPHDGHENHDHDHITYTGVYIFRKESKDQDEDQERLLNSVIIRFWSDSRFDGLKKWDDDYHDWMRRSIKRVRIRNSSKRASFPHLFQSSHFDENPPPLMISSSFHRNELPPHDHQEKILIIFFLCLSCVSCRPKLSSVNPQTKRGGNKKILFFSLEFKSSSPLFWEKKFLPLIISRK